MSANAEEPAPKAGTTAVWPLVVEDMKERNEIGTAKYGRPLELHNGRKSLIDAYQECLDLVVYLRQQIAEENDRRVRFELVLAQLRRECDGLSHDQETRIKEALGFK